jgi:hypothetical protein
MQIMKSEKITFRTNVKFEDIEDVMEIVRSTGFFREDEILVARELVDERFHKGAESGYEFIFAEMDGKTIAYSCYGLIPCTLKSYDLYWIATHKGDRPPCIKANRRSREPARREDRLRRNLIQRAIHFNKDIL